MGLALSKTKTVELNFGAGDDAEASAEDADVSRKINELLAAGKEARAAVDGYEGGSALIRDAMSNPSNIAKQAAAFESLLPNVDTIKSFYDLGQSLENTVPKLLLALTESAEKESLTKGLCELLEFAISFDQVKMSRPNIQNDFSFYRRSIAKRKNDPNVNIRVNDAEAAMVSMFVAESAPMLMALTKSAKAALEQDKEVAGVIAVIANSCCKMMAAKKVEGQDQNVCLYAMTGAILLYDHSTPSGVFYKSPVQVKKCIKELKQHDMQQLQNVIRYSSIHFNDDTTPSSVRRSLE
jgi:hypothetical protein